MPRSQSPVTDRASDLKPEAQGQSDAGATNLNGSAVSHITDAGSAEKAAGKPAGAADDIGKALPVEIGGRDGPEPTRFGDWEKRGRCVDF